MESTGWRDGTSVLSATFAPRVGIQMRMARTVAYEGGSPADVRGAGVGPFRYLPLLPHARGGAVYMGLLAEPLRPHGALAATP